MAEIYLDNASTCPPLQCAIDAFNDTLLLSFGNPSSAHAYGQRARDALEDARARIAKCINADPEEIIFTSGATEAAKLAIHSLEKSGQFVFASPYEHHAVGENIVKDPNFVRSAGESSRAVMLVNNETGTVFDFKSDTERFRYSICDATSALGHIPIDVKELGCSYLFGGAHKFGGLPGAGFLYAEKDAPIVPIFQGGGQERGARAGTESVALISAMASALEWQDERIGSNFLHVQELRSEMMTRLHLCEPVLFNGQISDSSPYILNVSFPGVEGSALVLLLSKMGVMVSAGAACTTGDNAPSHVLMAMYGDENRARSAIRISFSHETTLEEVKLAAEKIAEAVKTLRNISAQ